MSDEVVNVPVLNVPSLNEAPIRTCYAFNRTGQRCDMPAGHPGLHSITLTFSDDDMFVPGASPSIPAYIPAPVLTEQQPLPESPAGPWPALEEALAAVEEDVTIDLGEPDHYTESGLPVYTNLPAPQNPGEEPTDSCVACDHPRARHGESGCTVGYNTERECECRNFI
jgi:hypothetical protein